MHSSFERSRLDPYRLNHFDLPPELSKVSRNGEIIAQLIEELIVNAIRHGKAKNITVSAQVEGGRCLISVLDDGRLKSTKKSGLGSTLFEVFAPTGNSLQHLKEHLQR